MADCRKLDPLVTPYVDGELDARERADVDSHLRVCPPCHSRVTAEQAVRDLLHARKHALELECASAALRAKCAGHKGIVRANKGYDPFSRVRALALAAALVLVVGGAFLYEATDRSSRVMAAELVADHVKCFAANRVLGTTTQSAGLVEQSLASSFGWHVRLPPSPQEIGLELIGARPCLYGEGRMAHLMYRHNGQPVSVFMLPNASRQEALVSVLGHECAIWSEGDRTFVVVARERREDMAHVASFVRASLR